MKPRDQKKIIEMDARIKELELKVTGIVMILDKLVDILESNR